MQMMPHQSQGACMAIEDSACLGIVFSKKYFNGDVPSALRLYERTRKHRATRVQAASARAAENIHERIGMTLDQIAEACTELLTDWPRFFQQHEQCSL